MADTLPIGSEYGRPRPLLTTSSGGGGGGGTPTDVATGIDTSADIESIKASLGATAFTANVTTGIDTSTDIETIKTGINSIDTKVSAIDTKVATGIDASTDVEAIKTGITSIDTKVTAIDTKVATGLDASVDIEAIKTATTAINTKLGLSSAQAIATSGVAGVLSLNLDSTGLSRPLLVDPSGVASVFDSNAAVELATIRPNTTTINTNLGTVTTNTNTLVTSTGTINTNIANLAGASATIGGGFSRYLVLGARQGSNPTSTISIDASDNNELYVYDEYIGRFADSSRVFSVRLWNSTASNGVVVTPASILNVVLHNVYIETLTNNISWVMFFIGSSPPSNGNTPLFAIKCLANSTGFAGNVQLGASGLPLGTVNIGQSLYWAVSTTGPTLTLSANTKGLLIKVGTE